MKREEIKVIRMPSGRYFCNTGWGGKGQTSSGTEKRERPTHTKPHMIGAVRLSCFWRYKMKREIKFRENPELLEGKQ